MVMDNCKRIDELALKFKDNFDFENNCIKDSYKKKVFWELSQLHISSVDVSFSVYDNTLQECDYEIKMEEGFNQPIDVSSSIFGLCKQYINADAGVNPLDTSGVYLEFFPEHLQELESFSGNLIWNVLERKITLFTDETYETQEDFDECVWEKQDEPEPEIVEKVPKKKKNKK
jgi:hypothetical protein